MASLNCNSCKSKDITKKIIGDYFFHICNNCFGLISNHKANLGYLCCDKSNIQYVLFAKEKSSHVVKQCLSCGFKPSGMFKKSLLGDKVHLFNAALYSYYKKKQSKHDKEINKLKSFYAYKRRCRLKSEWFEEEYNEYLSSEVWHYKRERVLKRDEKICRACGINEATQVHHLSYRFVGNEPLFDLVSICARCHDKITQLDENEVKNNFNIE